MKDTVRVATADDAPALYRLLQQSYAPLAQQGIHFTITRTPFEQVREKVLRESTFVLERTHSPHAETEIVATLTVRFPWLSQDEQAPPYPFIHWFAVSERYKRQRAGSALLDHVETAFLRAQIKAPAVYLATAVGHPWLRNVYERRGYEPFRHSINALGTPLVWLRKILIADIYRDLPEARRPSRDELTTS
ncbi:GNAT family N-acetyltransferase [Paraburkholderia terricola]|uniref:Ribosomal protein S18 acetylase RimI n=1 Tax=Paraburkholderia terricola TaxID=169427 RepID=A0A1M6LZZ4_9BURK|nr:MULTISPECIES: GNAT family N-acetyltransferase [Paraburkholderia]AXE92692.1 N-acetyltransferase [Paraburkholderia terricola]MDR6448085.1 GNAT superfamily N-acetyltransferase [Paraburkholderia terricola]SDN93182.1 Ribosomal protein S18 acetylase RimI [Paraburkholderia sediminicola]SHJ76768.1 Ribosomal protein S18 acetylase RimI [Paraburkholderia terricola]